MSPQLQSGFIQMISHLCLPWFRVIALVQSRIPGIWLQMKYIWYLHVCAKRGEPLANLLHDELWKYSCIVLWVNLWVAFMYCYISIYVLLELWAHKRCNFYTLVYKWDVVWAKVLQLRWPILGEINLGWIQLAHSVKPSFNLLVPSVSIKFSLVCPHNC